VSAYKIQGQELRINPRYGVITVTDHDTLGKPVGSSMASLLTGKPEEKIINSLYPLLTTQNRHLLNKENIEQLLKLIPPRFGSNTSTSSSLIARTGNFPFGFVSSSTLAP
jgi:hypothetical protein